MNFSELKGSDTMKKALSLSLALLMFLSALVSCSEQPGTETEASASPDTNISSDAAESETVNERLLIPDNLPDKKFDGESYDILWRGTFSPDYVYAEDLTGEVVNDAVHNRNISIEDRFDVTITSQAQDFDDITNFVVKAVNAGTTDYDTVYGHAVYTPQKIGQNLFVNLKDLEYIDFDQPWWNTSSNDILTVNDVCFFAIGDSVLSSIGASYGIIYDKLAIETNQLENPYEVTMNGKWTLDYVKKISEQIAKDLDGNGVMDSEDYYGYSTTNGSPNNAYIWAFGLKIYSKNSTGDLEYTFFSERTVDCMNAITNLYVGSNPGIYVGEAMSMFRKQHTVFGTITLSQLTWLGDYENEYGVIPYPKYDELQEDYYSMADGWHSVLGVPNLPINMEFAGLMIEAMCAETYKTVTPAYLDVCLKTRYSSSLEDAEMIDLCVRNCVFDFGYIYDGFNGISFLPQTLTKSNRTDFASYYAKFEKVALIHYNKMLDVFYNYEG